MAFAYKNISSEQATDAKAKATTKPAPPAVDDALLTAWELDHAAHTALLADATTDEAKATHTDALKALEQAIVKGRAQAGK